MEERIAEIQAIIKHVESAEARGRGEEGALRNRRSLGCWAGKVTA